MAGDWIKMQTNLLTHPKVVRMMSALKADKFRIIGGLMSVWCLFDAHSEDGKLSGYSPETLDSMAAWEGFSAAMLAVEWLFLDGETLHLPRFEAHNGLSAKKRAQDSERKRDVRNLSASQTDKKRTREEKNREDINTPIVPTGDEQSMLSAYHRLLPKCQRVEVLNPKRRKRIATLCKLARSVCASQGWPYDAERFWLAYFAECAKDPWMRGDVPNPKNAAWKQNLDVLLAEDRFASVMDKAIASLRGAA